MKDYVIRTLTQKADIDPIEQLQEDIWNYGKAPGQPFPYPGRCLFEFAESGGHIAGTYSSAGELIGFSAAWLGRERTQLKRLYLHSQLVGIKEEWRNAGIGKDLKLYQRSFALSEQIPMIKWTFDPLQARNANLNLGKLGGMVREFIPDYYGNLSGKLNQGFPTDRFWVEWHIASPWVRARLDQQPGKTSLPDLTIINKVEGPTESRRCISVMDGCHDARLLVELPPNITEMRAQFPDLAMQWQSCFREIFGAYLGKYVVADCLREDRRSYYVLIRQELTELINQIEEAV